MESVLYGNKEIRYTITRSSKISNMQLILKNGSVIIKAPTHVDADEIKDVVKRKIKWIIRHQKEQIERAEQIKKFSNNAKRFLLFEGRDTPYHVKTMQQNDGIIYEKGRLLISTKSASITIPEIKDMYHDWLADRYLPYIDKKVASFKKMLDVTPGNIRLKCMTSKWGSASSSGNISLNCQLLKAPVNMIDYVILHELAHLKIKNHSKNFWDYLGMFMGDYEKRAQWLKANTLRIQWS